MLPTTFTTPRLTLTPLSSEDHEFVYTLVNSTGWLEFISDGIRKSAEDIAPYIEKIIANPECNYWVIRLQNTSTPIGIITFMKRAYLEYFDLGFALLPEFAGAGYAFEAASHVLHVLAGTRDYDVIMATTIPNNTSSQRLLEKLGFTYIAEMVRDDERLMIYDIDMDTMSVN